MKLVDKIIPYILVVGILVLLVFVATEMFGFYAGKCDICGANYIGQYTVSYRGDAYQVCGECVEKLKEVSQWHIDSKNYIITIY